MLHNVASGTLERLGTSQLEVHFAAHWMQPCPHLSLALYYLLVLHLLLFSLVLHHLKTSPTFAAQSLLD